MYLYTLFLASGFFTLYMPVLARFSLNVEVIPHLIKSTDYAFHSICENFENPDLFFNEEPLSEVINAYTTNLQRLLHAWNAEELHQDTPSFVTGTTTATKTLVKIAISPLRFLRRRQLNVDSKGSQKVSTHSMVARYHEDSKQPSQKAFDQAQAFTCTDLHENLNHFVASFQNMTYAISEKCHRQCDPWGLTYYALGQLQLVLKRHYQGSTLARVRGTGAQKGCVSMDEISMVEPREMVNLSKTWIHNFRSENQPCAGIKRR